MEIKLYTTVDSVARVSNNTSTKASRPIDSDSDVSVFETSRALEARLKDLPDVRVDKVEDGKRLIGDPTYPPMVIGWRMRLVSNEAGPVWAADEVFDAADQGVSNSARRYNRSRSRNNPVLEDSRSILLSPSEFGQYTLASVLGTLPMR